MVGKKRSSGVNTDVSQKRAKLTQSKRPNIFRTTLQNCGLTVNDPPEVCILDVEPHIFSKKFYKYIRDDINYPANLNDFIVAFEKEMEDPLLLKHCLQTKLMKNAYGELVAMNESLFKVLLNQSVLQTKLLDIIFDRAIDFAVEGNIAIIQAILKCFVGLDSFEHQDKLASHLINLLDITDNRSTKMEILSFIPDITQSEVHDTIAEEISRFLIEDHELLPVLLNCLTFLNINDSIYNDLQKRALSVLRSSPRFTFFPNIVKFLLMPGRLDESGYIEVIQSLRSTLNWKNIRQNTEDIPSNQVMTAMEIYNSIISTKLISECWFKSIQNCKTKSDHYDLDIPILVLLYNCLDSKQNIITLIKKQVKANILTEDLLQTAFDQYTPMLKNYLYPMLELVSSLLKLQSENTVIHFASKWYMVMFTSLEEFRPTIIAEIIQRGLSSKKYFMDGVAILKEIGDQDLKLLLPQSLQLLALLDRLDELNFAETREIMTLLCGLAYQFEDSALRDDVHMFITKQLRSADFSIKVKGVLSAVSAIKYLMVNTNEETETEATEGLSYNSYEHFSEGPTKQAAQLIQTITTNMRQTTNICGCFYDELSDVISSTDDINKHFLSYLSEAATNDLQTSFIVDEINPENVNDLLLTMQYGINAEDELDGVIAVNIAGKALQKRDEDKSKINVLPALLRFVHNIKIKQNALSSIDALLGCPLVLPVFSIDTCIDDLDLDQLSGLLDCLIISINWFRELINAFASQTDIDLRKKIMQRINQTKEIQKTVNKIISEMKGTYKPPVCSFNISNINNNVKITKTSKPAVKSKSKVAKPDQNNTLPPTAPTQQNANMFVKTISSKYDDLRSIPLCRVNFFSTALLLAEKVATNNEDTELNLDTLYFLIIALNENLNDSLKPYFYKVSHFKKEITVFDSKKALAIASKMSELIPHLLDHVETVLATIINESTLNEVEPYSSKLIEYEMILEQLFKSFTIYFNWINFRNTSIPLLKTTLRIIALKRESDPNKVLSLNDLVILSMEYFKKFGEYCKQISTAVALLDLLSALYHVSENDKALKIIKTTSKKILAKTWYQFDGIPERGLFFNQHIDHVLLAFFMNPELKAVKSLCTQVQEEVPQLKDKADTLGSFNSISKSNFPILFRHMVAAVGNAAKKEVEKPLTNHEHLELWKDVATILKILTEIAKAMENRNNFSSYLKRSQPVLKLFISHGMPIIEIKMKNEMDLAIEVLKILQSSTRFMQNLCCHSRLKKDTALLAKVPQIRLLLESLVYKVKAALAANKCSEAFWMGNLKNKNLQGEVISTQASVEEQEDADDQLPPDESPEDSDGEDNNAEMKSTSDIADTSG